MPSGGLDVFKRSDGESEKKQREAQLLLLKAVQEKQGKDEVRSWKEKLVGMATLGGKIKARNPGVANSATYGIKDGHSLYGFGKNNRLSVIVSANRARELIRPMGQRSYGTLAKGDSAIVLARLSEGDAVDSLPVTTGLTQSRVNSALAYLAKTNQINEGVIE